MIPMRVGSSVLSGISSRTRKMCCRPNLIRNTFDPSLGIEKSAANVSVRYAKLSKSLRALSSAMGISRGKYMADIALH